MKWYFSFLLMGAGYGLGTLAANLPVLHPKIPVLIIYIPLLGAAVLVAVIIRKLERMQAELQQILNDINNEDKWH